jgi:hypothetical protein
MKLGEALAIIVLFSLSSVMVVVLTMLLFVPDAGASSYSWNSAATALYTCSLLNVLYFAMKLPKAAETLNTCL